MKTFDHELNAAESYPVHVSHFVSLALEYCILCLMLRLSHQRSAYDCTFRMRCYYLDGTPRQRSTHMIFYCYILPYYKGYLMHSLCHNSIHNCDRETYRNCLNSIDSYYRRVDTVPFRHLMDMGPSHHQPLDWTLTARTLFVVRQIFDLRFVFLVVWLRFIRIDVTTDFIKQMNEVIIMIGFFNLFFLLLMKNGGPKYIEFIKE